ncbi:hypothetical protein VPNG_04034 [Cytospora leucostoma]|uniref:DUF1275 domain protein n=1 Tax=Cytospora leucostoma TaxID=1230097 RepID=A0A423XD42_9PEZI|nr:hypothetical protein VPNG_04034 [Cytospora leucostoma]
MSEKGNDIQPETGDSTFDLNERNVGPLRRRWTTIIDSSLANVPLLGCCFITGLLDTTMFQAYGTFVSMQTGNTIFLALGASNQNNKPYDWARSLCSIGCFSTGAVFFSRLHRYLGPQPTQRGILSFSFFVQAVCICVAAALIQGGTIPSQHSSAEGATDWSEMAPIAFLSFQAAGQIVASRVLGVNELPTVVITSLLCDLMSDPKLLSLPVGGNKKRNNRILGFVLTLVGSIIGGWMLKGTGKVSPVLWLVFGFKFVISLAWFLWKGESESRTEVV